MYSVLSNINDSKYKDFIKCVLYKKDTNSVELSLLL